MHDHGIPNMHPLQGLLKHVDDPKFQTKWAAVKQTNKERLAHYVEVTTGHKINTKAMFDVQIKVSRDETIVNGVVCLKTDPVVYHSVSMSTRLENLLHCISEMC